MVLSGAWQIFERSLVTYNVRYIEYLGDGEPKGFVSIVESQPYGEDCNVSKLECAKTNGHLPMDNETERE